MRGYTLPLAYLTILTVAIATGCASTDKSRSTPTSGTPSGQADPMAASDQVPAGEQQATPEIPPKDASPEAFARRIATTLAAGDPMPFARAIDLRRIIARGSRDLEISQATLDTFTGGFARTFILHKQIAASMQNGGQLRLLRVRPRDGAPQALLRAVVGSGVNYYELRIEETEHAYRVADIYIHMNGEYVSDSVRRVLLPIAAAEKDGGLDGISVDELDFVKHAAELQRTRLLAHEGDLVGALAIFDDLPESLRTNKNILLMRLSFATKASRAEYAQAIDDLQANFPDDPALDLPMIDGHFLRGETGKAIATIDRLNNNLEGDAYLQTLAGNILAKDDRAEKAKVRYWKAISMEPTLKTPYWQLIALSLAEKDFPTTAELLDALETQLDLTLNDLTSIPLYEEFVESEAYETWQTTRDTE